MSKRTIAIFASMLALTACDNGGGGSDSGTPGADSGTHNGDSGTPGTDGGGGGGTPTCAAYCDEVTMTCTGDNADYASRDECIQVCTGLGWAAGDAVSASGPASGDTIGCRTYHGGVPATADPATHCPHAGETGGNVCGTWCENYCGAAMAVCTGGDAIYTSMDECMTACAAFDATGSIGDTSGDTVQCRLYHLGVGLRTGDTGTHCPHAGVSGGGVCVGSWTFRSDGTNAYTRVDRMGMPAVSTALVSDTGGTATTKNDYNDGNPSDDVAGTFAPELVANLTALHGALDDDLTGLSLTPCSMSPTPDCLSQEVAPGVSVQSLVIPDTLTINTGAAAGFPNGRMLPDQAIDVTLGVVLLDLTVSGQTPATLAGVPVNPTHNDVDYSTDFPYLAPPHAP